VALTYQNKINFQQGLPATDTVNIKQRIDQCVKENCSKMLKSEILRAQLIHSELVTDQQFNEFALRGVRGAMSDMIMPIFMQDNEISGNLTPATMDAITDDTLNSIFLYAVWPLASKIGTGVL
jgi:hypothetical protein